MASISNPLTSNASSGSAPAPSNPGSSASPLPGANEQTFLQLLVTQLKNQDPTNPVDGTQFVAQLATFSQLEQMINANTKLQQIHVDLTGGQGANPPTTGNSSASAPSLP